MIVDEIQKGAGLFDYIKDLVDNSKEKGQFFLTGSQSLKLMKNVSESFAGRAGVMDSPGALYLNKTQDRERLTNTRRSFAECSVFCQQKKF